MTNEEYEIEAARTVSPYFFPERIDYRQFITVVTSLREMNKYLDAIKKALFYGKESDLLWEIGSEEDAEDSLRYLNRVDPKLLHAVLGKVGEAIEVLEVLYDGMLYGKTVDLDKLNEEAGDGLWFDALLFSRTGTTISDEMRKNIEKLRARFPNKFDQERAINK